MSLWKVLTAVLCRPAARRPQPRRLLVEALEDRCCLSSVSVFATGFNNPRGLTFGPDSNLYVAEGGSGGTASTVGLCDQVPAPVGPYTGGYTARIARINPAASDPTTVHQVTTVASGLPSSQTSPSLGSLVSGVADVKFLGDTLYGIEAGAGCSHGLIGTDNTIFRVNADGSTTTIADLSAFQQSHPVVNPEPADFEPDGTWYSMVAVRGALYAVEPNHGELDKITPDGQISRVIDVSASQGHVVPTAVAYHGNFYVGNLGRFGPDHQPENIYKVTPSGQIVTVATGLSEVLGVAFDAQGRMYALESSTGGVAPIPGSGDILRFNDDGTRTVIADHLFLPTAMTFGPDGALYVSNIGFGPPPVGLGQILRIDLDSASALSTPAAAQVPFQADYQGTFTLAVGANGTGDLHFTGAGIASLLGLSAVLGHTTTSPSTIDPGCSVIVTDQVILTAANGDQLWLVNAGEDCLDGNVIRGSGTFQVIGGTGRFARATGSGTFQVVAQVTGFATTGVSGTFDLVFTGTMTLGPP
jgi:hypothetical protein